MILHALTQYYDALAARGEISPPGWCDAKVSFALKIGEDGGLLGIFPLRLPSADGKKEVPQILRVPEQVKKTVDIKSNFLCENSSYLLGLDSKGKPTRTLQCFEAACAKHREVLSGVDSPTARAVLAYFDRWDPAQASSHPALSGILDDILKGGNLVFWVEGGYAQDDPAIRTAWETYRGAKDVPAGRCLVTGEVAPVALLHPSIKGVRDAQSSGASLVSFNADAFESYGKELRDKTGQGFNAPVSERAAFAYGTALNHLLADRAHVQYIGDTTVVYWAADGDPLCQDLFGMRMFGTPSNRVTQNDLDRILRSVLDGVAPDGFPLQPDNHFYVLGLAPSAARLSVRFFYADTFARTMRHVEEHSERLRIVPEQPTPYLWRLLNETVNRNGRDKKASPPMAGAVMRAILTGSAYPATLFEMTMIRIRAEQAVTRGRAAILKAFLLKNNLYAIPKEVLTVELNEQSTYLPYVLGRLFAVLERVQLAANPGIKATIKDKYFNSASATPATIFPLLTKLSQSHLRKLSAAYRIYFEKLIGDLEGRIHQTLPTRLPLPEQGTFHLGYYHQVQKFFERKQKEETNDV